MLTSVSYTDLFLHILPLLRDRSDVSVEEQREREVRIGCAETKETGVVQRESETRDKKSNQPSYGIGVLMPK